MSPAVADATISTASLAAELDVLVVTVTSRVIAFSDQTELSRCTANGASGIDTRPARAVRVSTALIPPLLICGGQLLVSDGVKVAVAVGEMTVSGADAAEDVPAPWSAVVVREAPPDEEQPTIRAIMTTAGTAVTPSNATTRRYTMPPREIPPAGAALFVRHVPLRNQSLGLIDCHGAKSCFLAEKWREAVRLNSAVSPTAMDGVVPSRRRPSHDLSLNDVEELGSSQVQPPRLHEISVQPRHSPLQISDAVFERFALNTSVPEGLRRNPAFVNVCCSIGTDAPDDPRDPAAKLCKDSHAVSFPMT